MFRVTALAVPAILVASIAQADMLSSAPPRSVSADDFNGVRGVLEPEAVAPTVADLDLRIDGSGPMSPPTSLPLVFHNGLSFNDPEYVDPHRQRVTGNSGSIFELRIDGQL